MALVYHSSGKKAKALAVFSLFGIIFKNIGGKDLLL